MTENPGPSTEYNPDRPFFDQAWPNNEREPEEWPLRVEPFGLAEGWHGYAQSFDGTDCSLFEFTDIADLQLHACWGDEWDGNCAAVFRLHDGRWVAFETFYGPTGDGFYEDAYGGDADLTFGSTIDSVLRFGLTDEGRRVLAGKPPEDD